MKLWIGNISPDVSDAELIEFVCKYGSPSPSHIQRVPGDGSRPAAILSFDGYVDDKLVATQTRLNGMYWKGRELAAQTLVHFSG